MDEKRIDLVKVQIDPEVEKNRRMKKKSEDEDKKTK